MNTTTTEPSLDELQELLVSGIQATLANPERFAVDVHICCEERVLIVHDHARVDRDIADLLPYCNYHRSCVWSYEDGLPNHGNPGVFLPDRDTVLGSLWEILIFLKNYEEANP